MFARILTYLVPLGFILLPAAGMVIVHFCVPR
jgi:hypothetical protein